MYQLMEVEESGTGDVGLVFVTDLCDSEVIYSVRTTA